MLQLLGNNRVDHWFANMKVQYFILKTPNGYSAVQLSWHRLGVNFEHFDGIDPDITLKSIKPIQLVYAIKEFNLLDTFRRRVYRFLKQLNTIVGFDITEPQKGLVDHAW